MMTLMLVLLFIIHLFIITAHGHDECPVWMEFENSTDTYCQCILPQTTTCTQDSVIADEWYCIGYGHVMMAGHCPYSDYQQEYSKNLNSSVTYSEFNEIVCGPLNREGLFCSKCKPGYGIPVFSKATDECVKCGSKLTWFA